MKGASAILAGLMAVIAASHGTSGQTVFDVRKYGAQADDQAPDTTAIQAAINGASHAGGGRVLIPSGRFICGPIRLGSRVDLHLAKGAMLTMSDVAFDYPVAGGRHESFISGEDLQQITISGEGEIDGQGESWWRAFRANTMSARRPQMIYLSNCEGVILRDFTTRNPPNTHCSLKDCRDITVEGLTMLAPDESPNTDALNLSGAKNVRITRCRISTGDDNIVFLTSGSRDANGPGVENVLVSNCTLGFGHGLSIGSYTSGSLRTLRFENITFDGTTSGIRIKSNRGRGGVVEDVVYRDIKMTGVTYPIYLTSYYPKVPTNDVAEPKSTKTPVFRNITIANVTADSPRGAGMIVGLPEAPIENVTLENVNLTGPIGMTLRNVRALTVRNTTVRATKGGPPFLLEGNAQVSGLPVGLK